MRVEHIRVANVHKPGSGRAYCISHVYINGVYSHDVIEDYDRGLDQSMTEAQVKAIKVYGKTAIPTGIYTVKLNIVSSTFVKKQYYKDFCGGKVPRLDPVVGFNGILLHRGIDENSSAGCPIVGLNKEVGKVTHSKEVFEAMCHKFWEAEKKGETITYKITRKYKV